MHSPEINKAIELVEFICGGADNVCVTLSYWDAAPDLTKYNDLTISVENGSFCLDEKTFPRDTAKEEIVRFILKSGLKLAKKIRKMEADLGTVTVEAVEQEITAAKIEPPNIWHRNYYCTDPLIMEPVYINQESDTKKKRKKK